MLNNASAGQIGVGVTLGYLVLYSGYDKATKKFDIVPKLTKIFSFKNPSASLMELNKAIGLTTMTLGNVTALLCMCPDWKNKRLTRDLALQTLAFSLTHGVYSALQYRSRFFGPKWLAMLFGALGMHSVLWLSLSLDANAIPFLPRWFPTLSVGVAPSVAIASVAITVHVFLMERKAETKSVEMRPFGYYGLVLSGLTTIAAVVALHRGLA